MIRKPNLREYYGYPFPSSKTTDIYLTHFFPVLDFRILGYTFVSSYWHQSWHNQNHLKNLLKKKQNQLLPLNPVSSSITYETMTKAA